MTYHIQHSQFIRQSPCLGLINPHQRSVDYKLLVHSQVQRHIERLDKRIATIGIATEICLGNSRYQMIDATLTGIDSRYAQEKQVASRHECIRKTIRRFFLIHYHARIRQ